MSDEKLSMARLALAQLSRKERMTLVKELKVEEPKPAAPAEARLLRRREVAERLSVSLRTVDSWARQGLLVKRRLPGRKRASGFSSVEIERLIAQAAPRG